MLVLIRAGSAAAALALILAASRRSPFPPDIRKRLPAFAVMAIAYSVIPWTMISWGELYISSGLASILNATVPLFTVLIAYWATPCERPTLLNLAGVLVGLGGTVILVAPEFARRGVMSGSALGALAGLTAALSYAAASIYQRRRLAGVNVFVATFWQVTLATVVMLPLSAPSLSASHLHAASLGAALALGVGATGAGLAIYYYLLNSLGATRAATTNFLLPVTAVFWGVTLLHEAVSLSILLGMAVVLIGVFFTSRRPAVKGPTPMGTAGMATPAPTTDRIRP